MSCFMRVALLLLCLNYPGTVMAEPDMAPGIKQMFGQKLMLDLRYYCEQLPVDGQCRTPMTTLPPAASQAGLNAAVQALA